MRFAALLLVPVAMLLVAADDDAVKKDVAKMQGTWVFTKYVNGGIVYTDKEQLKKLELTVKENMSTFRRVDNDNVTHSRHTLRPNKNPKEIDIEILDGPDKGKTLPGIYAVDGDELRLCINRAGKDRPKKFESEAGSENVLQVLKKKP
jgi:uncharacterized protein (TIGR03067 family)